MKTIMPCCPTNIEEIYRTEHGAVYQCSRKNCYWLEYGRTTTAFRVSDFRLFKKHIDGIDVQRMLTDVSPGAGVEIVMPPGTERCFILTVQDVLDLREILSGAKFMIEFNSTVGNYGRFLVKR